MFDSGGRETVRRVVREDVEGRRPVHVVLLGNLLEVLLNEIGRGGSNRELLNDLIVHHVVRITLCLLNESTSILIVELILHRDEFIDLNTFRAPNQRGYRSQ